MGCKHGIDGACTRCGDERELEALRADAGRYRWLRDSAAAFVVRPLADRPGGEWDAAIDAAMSPHPAPVSAERKS